MMGSGAEHTFPRRLATRRKQWLFYVHTIRAAAHGFYGRVARSYTRLFGGNLRADLGPCSSTRPPL